MYYSFKFNLLFYFQFRIAVLLSDIAYRTSVCLVCIVRPYAERWLEVYHNYLTIVKDFYLDIVLSRPQPQVQLHRNLLHRFLQIQLSQFLDFWLGHSQ